MSIPMTSIKSLTLSHSVFTTSRRIASIPQLACIGSECNQFILPTSVTCVPENSNWFWSKNESEVEEGVKWTCEGNLEKGIKFGSLEVSCEGFSSANDRNVLSGSCGLSYTLNRSKIDTSNTEATVLLAFFIGLVVYWLNFTAINTFCLDVWNGDQEKKLPAIQDTKFVETPIDFKRVSAPPSFLPTPPTSPTLEQTMTIQGYFDSPVIESKAVTLVESKSIVANYIAKFKTSEIDFVGPLLHLLKIIGHLVKIAIECKIEQKETVVVNSRSKNGVTRNR